MSRIQIHAWIAVVMLALAVIAVKSAKPLVLEGRPDTDFGRIPLNAAGWSGKSARFDERTYKALPTCSLLIRYYTSDEYYAPVEMAIVYGTDLGDFHQPEVCLEGQGMSIVSKRSVLIRPKGSAPFEAMSLIAQGKQGRQAFVFWFFSAGHTSTLLGDYKVRILADRFLARRVRPSALVRISAQVLDSDEQARVELVRFAGDFTPYLRLELSGDPNN
jgi:EpsI family protein